MVNLFKSLFDLFFPRVCVLCRSTDLSYSKICKECYSKITFIESPYCLRCGVKLPAAIFQKNVVNPVICPSCSGKKFPFKRMQSVFIYDENSRDLLLRFKHADQSHLADLFAEWMVLHAHEMLREVDCIIPVPLHPKRLRHRQYNQSAELARHLSKLIQLPFYSSVLSRCIFKETQGYKGFRQRRLNVRGAFAVQRSYLIEGKHVLLVDDVMASGSTVMECSRELKRSGAKRVYILTVARTL